MHDFWVGDVVLFEPGTALLGQEDGVIIVGISTRQDNFWLCAYFHCFAGEIVGINTNAMTADKAGFVGIKIPFCSCGL